MTTALVTGAASGIGLELVRQLRAQGVEVLATCRQSCAELANTGAVVLEGIELTSPTMEKILLEKVGDRSIDLLFNNAGVFTDQTLEKWDMEGMRLQFEVNALAPFRVTTALLPHLRRGSKIIITTSRMGSIADNTSGGYYGYRMSKAAVNMLGKGLAVDLASRGIMVGLLHPGYVKTKMTGGQGEITAEASARGILKVVEALNPANSGGFWHSNGEKLPW